MVLFSETSLYAAPGLSFLAGILSGWLIHSRFGSQPSDLKFSDSSSRDSAPRRRASDSSVESAQSASDTITVARNAIAGATGPSVRSTFSLALDRHLPDAIRRGDALSVMLVHVGNRPRPGDRFGLRIDNKTLDAAGRLFATSVRGTDWVARFDTTIFAFLLPGAVHANSLIVAERLRKNISAANLSAEGGSARLALSIGTTDVVAGDSSASILRRAEEAMSAAIQAGGDCVRSQVSGKVQEGSSGNRAVVCSG